MGWRFVRQNLGGWCWIKGSLATRANTHYSRCSIFWVLIGLIMIQPMFATR
jgi:hypothetical protein